MKKTRRTVALLLAILLLCSAFVGCSSKSREQKVIGTCAGFDVLYEELRYVTLTYKDLFANTYGKDIWSNPESAESYRAELEEIVWDMMLNNYAVLAACLEYGMTKDDMKHKDIEAAVDAQVNEMIEQYGSKADFRADLESLYMTEHFLRFCFRVAQLENELMYILTQDLGFIEADLDPFIDWLEDGNCYYVQHVYIENDPGEDPEENRAVAEDIRLQLLAGADIADFVGTKVNEDFENVSPYFFVRDVYTKVMEDAVFALDNVGDVSEVVDTGDGYYVLVRLETDEAKLLLQSSDLLTSYQWAHVESVVDTFKSKIKLELNEYGKSIDLLEIQ